MMRKQQQLVETESTLDLNFAHMRAKIAVDMAEAMAPFQEKLKELDIAEAFLRRTRDGSIAPRPDGAPRGPRGPYRKHIHVVATRRKPRALLTPVNGPYTTLNQRGCIVDIVAKEPGLNPRQIVERMREGGFIFKSAKPVDSMYVALRAAVRERKIDQVDPTPEERTNGGLVTYYPVGHAKASPVGPVSDKTRKKGHTGIKEAIITVLTGAPEGGMMRAEVLNELKKRAFGFSHRAAHTNQVTWALQSLVSTKEIVRTGSGTSAFFSAKK